MKQKTILFFCLCLFSSIKALAYDAEIDGIYYFFSTNEASVTYDKDYLYKGSIVIPQFVEYDGRTYAVTSIGNYAFFDCSSLTSVTIPNSVTTIGDYAFSQSTSLTSVNIPNSVTSIGDHAFNRCTSLTSVNIPNSVTSIYGVFEGCSALTSITIPNSVTTIGDYAFFDCTGLTSITIPNSVTSIGDFAFNSCTALSSVNIPSSVTSIGDQAFNRCTALTSVNVDAGNTIYDSRDNCNGIIETKSNTLIFGCKNTKIPNSVTSIGNYAFASCTSLTSVNIPNSVTSIGNGAFRYCSSLTSVVSNIQEPFTFGSGAFANISSACVLTVPTGMRDAYIKKGWTTDVFKGGIIEKDSSPIIIFADANVKALCVANWDLNGDGELSEKEAAMVKYIDQVFWGNDNITSFEELRYFTGLTHIHKSAFEGCIGLTSITIPNSVTRIDYRAFEDCRSLSSVTIPNSVTSIGEYAFYNCTSLILITIPNSVTYIGESAFGWCDNLISVVSKIQEPFAFGSDAFANISSACALIVPTGMREAYIKKGWTTDIFKGGIIDIEEDSSPFIIFADANVKALCVANWDMNGDGELSETEAATVNSIGAVFSANANIASFEELRYFTGLTSIGYEAFRNCTSLTSVTIPNSVTSIGSLAFFGCSALTSITIPNSVTSIKSDAFVGCNGLISVNVDAGNTKYDSRDNCNGIVETESNTLIFGYKNTTIPSSVTSIGNYAFFGCSALTSVTIPSSVTSIENYAFSGCSALTSVTIPNSVTSIGNYAFSGCSALTSVTIPNSVTSIGNYTFNSCSGLTSVNVDAKNTIYDSRDNCNGIIETKSNTLIFGCKNTNIPNSVTSIGDYAFYGCSGLTSVNIPNSVTSIGIYAFADCSGLTSINIPSSVTSIGVRAFNSCSNLISVVSNIQEPFAFGFYAFANISSTCVLTVPTGMRDAYINCGWTTDVFNGGIIEEDSSPFIIFADANVKTLCVANWDLNGDGELSETEAAMVKSIGTVFLGNSNITSFDELRYFTGLTYIDTDAFRESGALTSVNIPNSVTNIGKSAFEGCIGLTSITIPNSVTSIGDYAFYACSGLTSITIPDSVTSIGDYAFYSCDALTSVNIPNSVNSIGNGAFYGCSGLTSVNIPNSVNSIGNEAFYKCSSLTSVVSNIQEPFAFGSGAFANISSACVLTVPTGMRDAYINCGWTTDVFNGGIIEEDSSPFIIFADANVKALCVANWDLNGDGELSETEAATVKSIGTVFRANTEITSFDELRYFTGLTYIDTDAFKYCSELTSVTIPNSVTSICKYAFEGCIGLTSIIIPNSVTDIGYGAFRGCNGLISVNVDARNTKYDSRDNCNGIIETGSNTLIYGSKNTAIPNSVTCIGEGAFENCSGLTSVTIPNSVTSIGTLAFSGCSGLISITIPNSVTSIGDCAFYGCSGLTSITIPNSVTTIGYYTFRNCSGLTSITIPNSVTSIGDYAFSDCSGLTSINIPNSVNSIGTLAFKYCSGLTSITISNSVTSIGDYAFYGCSGLTSVNIPNSVNSIGYNAFHSCSGLTSVNVDTGNTIYDSRDNCNGIIETKSNTLIFGCKNTNIPNSVTSIGNCAFVCCTGLTSVNIPNSVTSIGTLAFSGCTGLTSITIPNSVTSIGDYAFTMCTGLTSINIPSSVTSIGVSAFSRCSGLTSVVSNIQEPFVFGSSAFADISSACVLTVPMGMRDAYIKCGWTTDVFKGGIIEKDSSPFIIFADANVKALCVANWDLNGDGELSEGEAAAVTDLGEVFRYKTNISSFEELRYFTGLTSVGVEAFRGCSNLTSITIPNSLTSIGRDAFANCRGLTAVHISNLSSWCKISFSYQTHEDIYDSNPLLYAHHLFLNGVEIKELVIPDDITTIGGCAFAGCSGLTSVTIHGSVTSIDYAAFYKCNGLTSVDIPNSVTNIGNESFYGCKSLISVSIPNSVTRIGSYAFMGCGNLRSFTIGDNLTYIDEFTIPSTATIYTSIGRSLTTLWKAGYANIKEIGTERNLGAPKLSVADKSASSMNVTIENAHSGFTNTLNISGNKTALEGENMTISLKGLEPDTQYEISLSLVYESFSYVLNKSVKTEALTLTTLQPKVISEGNVILTAQTNLGDEETNAGFEWRRIDWTENFDSKSGAAIVYEGMMEGYIRSINSNYLWKFRPYYTSINGNAYYGEWKGLDPADYSYFEPTVRTNAKINVQGNTAEVKGYAMRGTDNVISQGFMYWKTNFASTRKKTNGVPSNAMVVEVKGNVMNATLENLEYDAEYCYVAFVTTSENETFYGEEQTFKTDMSQDMIDNIEETKISEDVTEIARYDINGRKLVSPQKGINIIRMSDGTSRKVMVK